MSGRGGENECNFFVGEGEVGGVVMELKNAVLVTFFFIVSIVV